MVQKTFKPQSLFEKVLRLTDEYLTAKIPAQGTLALLYLKNIFMFIAGGSIEAAKSLRLHLTDQIQKTKRVSHVKRENMLRKLYEIETFVHLMKIVRGTSPGHFELFWHENSFSNSQLAMTPALADNQFLLFIKCQFKNSTTTHDNSVLREN